jgi:uncharacterized protein (TIGR04551 family)
MSRLLAGLAAALLLAGTSRAQDEKKTDAAEVDARTKAAIQREVEKAKEDLRDEVRAEIQGAQSAAEFLGAVAEGPKLEFLQLDGYYRVRGQLLHNFDLNGGKDASGRYLFPVPLEDPANHSTLATANMRLRLEPTLNVSEHVRVRAQIDVLDNYVLGSSLSNLHDSPESPYVVPFYGSSRAILADDPHADRPAISPKRVWAEVQTPVGLLSFGRMPSEWGLGVLTAAGAGIDDDFGDTVDRIQFALPPVTTPIGRLTFVPILDFDNEGVLYADPHFGGGLGQPFDAEPGDDGRTWGAKAARLDTDDEVRRKLERNETSYNYGGYYNYRTQRWAYPDWIADGFGGTYDETARSEHVSAYAHVLDLWFRVLRPRWRLEAELVGVYGNIGNAWAFGVEDPVTQVAPIQPLGRVLLRQWGGSVVVDVKAIPNRVTLGLEVGAASGDDAPGFGTGRVGFDPATLTRSDYGSLDGPQFGEGDRTIRNFRFNPAYRVDLVLFRHILGQVTDAAYAKPKLRWDILPGLTFDAAVIYSRALVPESTPSASEPDGAGADASLGVEADGVLTYSSGDGFQAFGEWGVFQPMGGLAFQGVKLDRAHFLAFGIAVKF